MVLEETERPSSAKSSSDMCFALAPFHKDLARSATRSLTAQETQLDGFRPALPWTSDAAPASLKLAFILWTCRTDRPKAAEASLLVILPHVTSSRT